MTCIGKRRGVVRAGGDGEAFLRAGGTTISFSAAKGGAWDHDIAGTYLVQVRSVEDDGAFTIYQDSPIDIKIYGTGENGHLRVATALDQLLDVLLVAQVSHVLQTAE
jgi:hypothetical protein